MKFHLKSTLLILISIYFLTACSVNKLETINKNSLVSRKKAIVILDIKWVDNYFHIDRKAVKEENSVHLLLDDSLIKERLLDFEGNTSKFNSPLYYLNNFQFELKNENDDAYEITRFYRKRAEYEPQAIFDIAPGNYSMNNIEFITQQSKKTGDYILPPGHWSKKYRTLEGEFGQWELEPGKIYYLGSYTFYFKTKRFNYGMMNKFVLNKSVKYMGLKREDKFEQVKKELIKTKPWLTVDGMINLSEPSKWFHKSDEPLKFDPVMTESENQIKKPSETKPKEKRDTEKFFF